MPPYNRVKARILDRIATSAVTLTVHYPPARPAVSGSTATTTTPLSPLTGTRPEPTLVPATVTPERAAVTVSCLWLDVAAQQNITFGHDLTRMGLLGWVQGATAQARVAIADCALDADDPYSGTIFDGCEVVVANGRRYRVLGVEPIGPSFQAPYTYAVWLAGAAKQ
jgi:hypothetical protein